MTLESELEASLARLATRATRADLAPRVEDLGIVRELGSGVAVVAGLSGATIDEVVTFEGGATGQIFDLDHEVVRCVLFGSEETLRAGASVRRTHTVPRMPVGDVMLGRITSPLGDPRDGLGPFGVGEYRAVEQDAPGPLAREPVSEPLFTGLKVVDAAVPIGLGQRQLIVGDRSTGKTSLALDTIIRQRTTGVACVYVSVGAKRASLMGVVDELRGNGALAHTAVVAAAAEDPASIRYLAPYAGCTIAEWFAARGRPALIVYDDLTSHAEAYRELSLILRHTPSREAYPGDIFSVHARLMERAFKLSARHGGGSVTALPIVQTQRGNIAGFIPTNVISMTDGQIYLDAALFGQGQLPAVNVGLSVSRVGGDAQTGAMRSAAANLRLELSQYEEVKGFARFGAILDEATRRQIERGARLLRVLVQDERSVLPLSVEVAELWAFREGLLDDLDPEQIPGLERQLLDLASQFADLEDQLRTIGELDDTVTGELRAWVTRAKVALVESGTDEWKT